MFRHPPIEDGANLLREPTVGRRIVVTDEPKRRVVVTDTAKRRVNVADLTIALGAGDVSPVPAAGGSPVSWFAARQEVAKRLRSTGGRPGLPDAEPRKVTLTDEEWDMAKQLAETMAEPGFRPSVGQVAGILLGQAIRAAHASMPPVTPVTETQY
jgi:hypothetical protein